MWKSFFISTLVGKRAAVSCLLLLNTTVRGAPNLGADTGGISSCESLTKAITNISDFDHRLKMREGREQQACAASHSKLYDASIPLTSGMSEVEICDNGLGAFK